MQMSSDFMHLDTVTLRQKNKIQFEKWAVIIFVQCIGGSYKPPFEMSYLFNSDYLQTYLSSLYIYKFQLF